MSDRDEFAAHLKLFTSLGVAGISTDAAWRERRQEPRAAADGPALEAGEPTETVRDAGAVDAAARPVRDDRTGVDAAGRPVRDAGAVDAAGRLAALRTEIGDCTRCPLHAMGRRQVVFGVGNPDADLMFVGEAPGADEDVQGEPFVGRAGQLLTKIIEAIGLSRADVYIANVIKCRPPGNRNPEPVEIATCQPFLFEQIDTIRPRVVVALGTFAARTLLGSDAPISRLRGHVHDFRGGAKLVPTFHPAFLLRSPDRKRDVWEDMKKVRVLLADAE